METGISTVDSKVYSVRPTKLYVMLGQVVGLERRDEEGGSVFFRNILSSEV